MIAIGTEERKRTGGNGAFRGGGSELERLKVGKTSEKHGDSSLASEFEEEEREVRLQIKGTGNRHPHKEARFTKESNQTSQGEWDRQRTKKEDEIAKASWGGKKQRVEGAQIKHTLESAHRIWIGVNQSSPKTDKDETKKTRGITKSKKLSML